jgi:hypothetical protein
MERSFAIPAIGQSGVLTLAGIILFCLVLAGVLVWQSLTEPSLWLFVVLMVATAALFSWFLVSQQHLALLISAERLALKAPLYGRTIPLQEVLVNQIELVNLTSQSPYRLTWRANGLSVPGYDLGWFRSKGKGRVLAALTREQAVAIPTTKGYTLLVTMQAPEQFLALLSQIVPQ